MQTRPVNLFDLMELRSYDRDLIALDSTRAITFGSALSPISLLYRLNHKMLSYTAICIDGKRPVMGQVTQNLGDSFARLTFLSPRANLGGGELHLLDHLASRTGEWGALQLVAEVEEHDEVYQSLRRTGFSMYAWQKIWKLAQARENQAQWRFASSADMHAIQDLYNFIVPNLFQPVESFPGEARGLVCFMNNELQGYASLTHGPFGIWVQPLIHPDSKCIMGYLESLPGFITNLFRQPIYLCLRSYQAWLESMLEEAGAKVIQHQAVMVKHLSVMQREEIKLTVHDKAFAKPAAPVTRSSTRKAF